MIFSSQRQQAISGWLLENNPGAFADNLKLQKYLFFYEMSSYMENPEEAELDHLRGYEKGPVFSNVYGDYRHDYFAFEDASRKSFTEHRKLVNLDFAKHASFLVSIMNDAELSAFTHKFNVWYAKKDRIHSDERQVSLDKMDINSNDKELLDSMYEVYDTKLIDDSVVIPKGLVKFILSKEDSSNLSPEQEGLLEQIAENHAEDLENPVYVDISDNGALEID